MLGTPRQYWVPSEERQSVFLDGARVLMRRKWLFLSMALAGALIGYLSTLPRAPIYRARTLLDIQPLNENFFNMKASDPTASTTATFVNAESFLHTQIKLLQSDSVVDRVVDRLKTRAWHAPAEADRRSRWSAMRLFEPRTLQSAAAVAVTAETLKVRAVGATRLVEVLCDGSTPDLATVFCNTLTTQFIESSLEVRADMAKRTSEWLIAQLADLRKNLATSEERLQLYAKDAALVFSPDKETIDQERLRNLQNELTRVQAERMAKQSHYEVVVTRPTTDSPALREYSMRLTDLRRQRADLAVTLTPDHPRVQKLDAQIAELRLELQREESKMVARARAERDASVMSENLLQSAFAAQFKTVSGQAEKAVTYNMLRREVESERQLYEAMLQRVREAGFASAMRDSTIRVVDPAKVPNAPVSPSIPGSLAGGLALGCLFGMGLAFWRDNNDGRIRRPGDVTVQLGVPELGIIPGAGTTAASSLFSRRRLDGTQLRLGERPELLALSQSLSPVAEAFRAAMNSVLFASGGDSASRVIVVTSPGSRDGKTTLAMNLAAALAETGRRVLLVDADMRKPRLHELVNVDNSFGLHDLLASEEPLHEVSLERLAQPTAMHGLWLTPSGTAPRNISRLLHSRRLGDLISRLRDDFELIVLDTPPLLPVSDARLFGRASDGVLLVVRGNQTTQDDAIRARNMLASDGVAILGTIFNDWRGSTPSEYYSAEPWSDD